MTPSVRQPRMPVKLPDLTSSVSSTSQQPLRSRTVLTRRTTPSSLSTISVVEPSIFPFWRCRRAFSRSSRRTVTLTLVARTSILFSFSTS
ncbi:hypothetical protein EIP86_003855 [Pleurotus ostreatoroseus]|nr:hypothetical protein EIP86_003855 [Pleurotus ostreatoroseus]